MFWPETGGVTEEIARLATRGALEALLGPIPDGTDTTTWTAVRAIQLMNEAGQQRDAAEAVIARVRATTAHMRAVTRTWEPAANLIDAALDGTAPGPAAGETTGTTKP